MAAIKYKGSDGEFHLLNNILVKGIDIVQTSGTSSGNVMSQKAVTEIVSGINDTLTAHTSDTDLHLTEVEKTNIDSLASSIETVSGISSTDVEHWSNAYEKVSGITASTTAINSLSGTVGTMAYENASSYSSATEVSTALSNKADTATTLSGYGITDAYTKSETSGATELTNALNNKADSAITFTAGTGLSGGGDLSSNRTISLAMPTTYSAETYTSSTITSSEPVVYALVRYTGTTALANQVCPVDNLADGQQCNVIYQSANNNAYNAVISTDYVEPDGGEITLKIPASGYAEINYINIKGIIFVRGI